MYSYLMLSTAQAFPMVDVTECRETVKATLFDQKAKIAIAALDGLTQMANKMNPNSTDGENPNSTDGENTNELNWFSKQAITKMINALGDHARPLLFERVECKDGPGPDDFQPCRDLYGDTVCEQVALRKVEDSASGVKATVDKINIFKKKSTCKAIDRLDATAVSVAPRGVVAMTCNMEDSLESMELYIARGKAKFWKFYPECPEGLQLQDKSMEDAVYDKEQKTFTLKGTDVTDKVKCIRKPRKEAAQEVKKDLVSQLDKASKFAPAPYDDHAQKLEEALKKMTPEEILVHYDELMADPTSKMMEFTTSQIGKDIMKDQAKNMASEALDKIGETQWVQQTQGMEDLIEKVKEKPALDTLVEGVQENPELVNDLSNKAIDLSNKAMNWADEWISDWF